MVIYSKATSLNKVISQTLLWEKDAKSYLILFFSLNRVCLCVYISVYVYMCVIITFITV